MLRLLIAIVMLLALIFYALMGGADFGGGIWDLLAAGPRAKRQRHAIAEAIGPIWEANHVWLILVIVLLFTGFPPAFAAIMISLHIPITLMLIGIVLRGSAFIFRKYDSDTEVVQRRWSIVFGISSFVTPFTEGMILGALATGQIRVGGDMVTSGFFAGWLTPFAFSCGLFAVALFAFLAAVYLTVDTHGEPDLQNDFRARGIWTGLALAPIALGVFLASRQDAPALFLRLTSWWAPMLLVYTSLSAVAALTALALRRFAIARVAAVSQVTFILAGWALAQYPNLIRPDITLMNSAAPVVTLRLLMLALGAGATLLLPSLIFLLYIFKHKKGAVE